MVDREILEEDVTANEEECNFDQVRKSVNQYINLQHPIVFDQYDICQLVHDEKLNKLTISVMEKTCLELGLATPNPPVHCRSPFEQALKGAVALCSFSVRGLVYSIDFLAGFSFET